MDVSKQIVGSKYTQKVDKNAFLNGTIPSNLLFHFVTESLDEAKNKQLRYTDNWTDVLEKRSGDRVIHITPK